MQSSFRIQVLLLSLLPLGLLGVGCASSRAELADDEVYGSGQNTEAVDERSRAHPATVVNDIFSYNRKRKHRPVRSEIFYHKTCDSTEGRDFWSKTSYDCKDRF